MSHAKTQRSCLTGSCSGGMGTDANPHIDFNPKGTVPHMRANIHVQLQLSNHLAQKKRWHLALRSQNSCQRGSVRTDLQGVDCCAKHVVVSQAVQFEFKLAGWTQIVIVPAVGGPGMISAESLSCRHELLFLSSCTSEMFHSRSPGLNARVTWTKDDSFSGMVCVRKTFSIFVM